MKCNSFRRPSLVLCHLNQSLLYFEYPTGFNDYIDISSNLPLITTPTLIWNT